MIFQKIKQFLKWLAEAWEDYSKTESNRYNNGYYDNGTDKSKMNCCYCKTDWEIKNYGVSYRCVYPEFVSEPVTRLQDVDHTERLMSNVYGMEIEPKEVEITVKDNGKKNVDLKGHKIVISTPKDKFNNPIWNAYVKGIKESKHVDIEVVRGREFPKEINELDFPEPKGIDSLFRPVPCHPPIMTQKQCDKLCNYLSENKKREKVIDKIMEDLDEKTKTNN